MHHHDIGGKLSSGGWGKIKVAFVNPDTLKGLQRHDLWSGANQAINLSPPHPNKLTRLIVVGPEIPQEVVVNLSQRRSVEACNLRFSKQRSAPGIDYSEVHHNRHDVTHTVCCACVGWRVT